MGFLTVLIYVILSFSVGTLLVGLSLNLIETSLLVSYVEQLALSDFSCQSVRMIVC